MILILIFCLVFNFFISYSLGFGLSNQEVSISTVSSSRRKVLTNMNIIGTLIATTTLFPTTSSAKDELFKPNPLTNPILEQIRIMDQDYADNIKYEGELAPAGPRREKYAQLLVPILKIKQDLEKVDKLLHSDDLSGLEEANQILSQKSFIKLEFKKIFNAFADNIYYSDPDRANAYLGGGAIPKNEQSIAYLIRNDILTNLENLQAEVIYLLKEKKARNPLDTSDLFEYSKLCADGMQKYIELVSPMEIEMATKLIN